MHIIDRFNYAPIWGVPLKVWGNIMRAPSADRLLALWLHRIGVMGNKEAAHFKEWIKPGMRVIDVGANQGIYSLYFSNLTGPQGQVWAFEPEPQLYQSLEKNCAANHSRVKTFPLALGDEKKTLTLHRSLLNSGDNRLNASNSLSAGVRVEVVRLDETLQNESVDFMKIDVQGHELEVLKGAEGVFTKNPHMTVYFELWPYGLKQAGASGEKIFEFFLSRGFELKCALDAFQSPVTDFSVIRSQLPRKKYTNLLARMSVKGT